ncbi:MAG TPA: TA system VapC family ribonuclease toxin [Candidatus Sulfotelmatobacter sp.]|nr:TA system VapC family ribonuclease toxin [Candidatus Sulfotelmatobacter sp.]
MTTFLLDVNVLIALIDPVHIHHDAAHAWFEATGKRSWATCPMTENAVLRIVGDSRYPNSPGSPAVVAEVLEEVLALQGHAFWPDDVSLFGNAEVDVTRLLSARQVTDSYLLALASAHEGSLATFDRRLITTVVSGGSRVVHVIA